MFTINVIMITFSICYFGRCAYETYENIRNQKQIEEGKYPNQFVVDMETMFIYLLFMDSPIFLIFWMHHKNSNRKLQRRQTE